MRYTNKVVLALAAAVLLGASAAHAVGLNWTDKTTVIVDGTFQVSKPSPDWDTQTNDIQEEAVRWVLHRNGPNPIIKLIYDATARGKTAHDYAKIVRKDLEVRGVSVSRVENRVINGRNVSLIHGQGGKLNFLVAVYRDQNKGLKLECTAPADNFSSFANEFMASINSVRFMH